MHRVGRRSPWPARSRRRSLLHRVRWPVRLPAASSPWRSCASAAAMPFWISAIADGSVATARLMSVSRGIDRVEQRPCLRQRRLRGTDRVHQFHLLAGRLGRTASSRARVMFWSANVSRCLARRSTLSATEANAAGSNSLCSAASVCSDGSSRAVSVDHLLGQRVQLGGRVDHQIAQLVERLLLGVELPVGGGGGRRPPGSTGRGAAAASPVPRRRASGAP